MSLTDNELVVLLSIGDNKHNKTVDGYMHIRYVHESYHFKSFDYSDKDCFIGVLISMKHKKIVERTGELVRLSDEGVRLFEENIDNAEINKSFEHLKFLYQYEWAIYDTLTITLADDQFQDHFITVRKRRNRVSGSWEPAVIESEKTPPLRAGRFTGIRKLYDTALSIALILDGYQGEMMPQGGSIKNHEFIRGLMESYGFLIVEAEDTQG